ncbi:MAG: hypothetical protein ACTH32_06700 [Microbacterium gubbeenense]|uniref:hypothetical protein n=1 Tax=Microbacterium gubbeenense TaxID=159896 RepID=UPI003F977B03
MTPEKITEPATDIPKGADKQAAERVLEPAQGVTADTDTGTADDEDIVAAELIDDDPTALDHLEAFVDLLPGHSFNLEGIQEVIVRRDGTVRVFGRDRSIRSAHVEAFPEVPSE